MLSHKQKVGLFVAAAGYASQLYMGYKLTRANRLLVDHCDHLSDFANREAYLVMFLTAKLVEKGIELDEFDQMVMGNPPKLVDPENPNLYAEFLERYVRAGMNP